MTFNSFSKKQLSVLTWWCSSSKMKKYDAVICDGAVRSGKTVCMSISFIAWTFYNFSDASFAICGKTISSLRRNVISPLTANLRSIGFSCDEKISKNYIDISFEGKKNRFYLFGGKDESSASLIQGMTLSGILFDEVALMPRSFVEQALARCSIEGSKFWFNCNPENPYHWFYREWILKREEKNALYLHFTMKDNPSLSSKMIKRYCSLYSGAFYERFVRGRWVSASGLVYPMFCYDRHTFKNAPDDISEYYISCDYGTMNPTSMGLWGKSGNVWYRLCEYYHDARKENIIKTDEEYYTELEFLAKDRKITAVIVDPSAASFIECIKRHDKFKVTKAKNDVINGIRRVSDALKSGEIMISTSCADTLREFSLYRWDEKSGFDAVRKEYDHAMDDIRYFVSTAMAEDKPDNFFFVSLNRH